MELFRERGIMAGANGGFQALAVDATTVKEPGKTGSLWRIHYSVRLPSLRCDYFKITATSGKGTGESLAQFPIRPGDCILADRGYSTALGIERAVASGGQVTVRVNTGSLAFVTPDGKPFDLLKASTSSSRPGAVGSWPSRTVGGRALSTPGRVCIIRKSAEAARLAQAKIRKKASRKGHAIKPETLVYAKYVILFTTFPEKGFTASEVLEWYRLRWQVELVFKRFKSLAQLGHLPKYDAESAKAWLYGKLLAALLVEKPIHHASAISPWGYDAEGTTRPERLG